MLTLLSPAKTLNLESQSGSRKATQPVYLDQAETLVKILRRHAAGDLARLMGVSTRLAEENVARFAQWSRPFGAKNARQALVTFQGDVFVAMDIPAFTMDDFRFAQDHLRILSGLYGILRPLDWMQPYRLEMGTKLKTPAGETLYDFWGTRLTESVNRQLKKTKARTLLNLTSQEYFKALDANALNADIVTPVFKDQKNGGYKVISFFAKKARGMMAGHAIRKRMDDASRLKKFRGGGYRYSAAESTDGRWVFLRDEPV